MAESDGYGAGVSGPVPLLVFCIIGLLAFELWRSYTMTRQNAERSVQNLTHVIAEQTARTIQSVDLSLQSIVHDLRAQSCPGRQRCGLRADLLRRLAALPYVRALFVIEPDGYISHELRLSDDAAGEPCGQDIFQGPSV